jgi:hypothetical protein
MNLPAYLELPAPAYSPSSRLTPEPEDADALEDLVHQKSRLQARKLDILASEIGWRLRIAAENVYHLERDHAHAETMINELTLAANYRLRDHHEKAPFYRKLFEIETELRAQKTDCWRDVANVMRDFLATWELHEQAQARARFLHDVGSGPEGTL